MSPFFVVAFLSAMFGGTVGVTLGYWLGRRESRAYRPPVPWWRR